MSANGNDQITNYDHLSGVNGFLFDKETINNWRKDGALIAMDSSNESVWMFELVMRSW